MTLENTRVNLVKDDKIKRTFLSNLPRLTPKIEEKRRESINKEQHGSKLGRQSKFLSQIEITDSKGGNIEDYLQTKKSQSYGSFRNATSALAELKGFIEDQGDTLEIVVSDLLFKVEKENKDITKHIQKLLQGVSDNMQKNRPCYNCNSTGRKLVNGHRQQCKSCHGDSIKGPLGQKSRKIYLSIIKDILRFYGLLNNINEKNLSIKYPKNLKEKKYALEKKVARKIIPYGNNTLRRLLLLFLCMTGMRLNEAIQLKPEFFSFVDRQGSKTTREKMFRIRVDLPAIITKSGIDRYSIIHHELQEAILHELENSKREYLFHNTKVSSAHNNEERAFTNMREEMIKDGIKEMGLKYQSGRHKITIHKFRSLFITMANRVSGSDLAGDFGDNMAGHSDGKMKTIYDQMPDSMIMDLWLKAEKLLSFDQNNSEETESLRDEIQLLKDQVKQRDKDHKAEIEELNKKHLENIAEMQFKTIEEFEKRIAEKS